MSWTGVCERLLLGISTPYYLTMLPLRGNRILCNIKQVPNRHMTKVTKWIPAADTPRLHKSNRFNDNEFLVWTLVSRLPGTPLKVSDSRPS